MKFHFIYSVLIWAAIASITKSEDVVNTAPDPKAADTSFDIDDQSVAPASVVRPNTEEEKILIRDAQLRAAGGIYYAYKFPHSEVPWIKKSKSLVMFHHSPWSVIQLIWIFEINGEEIQIGSFNPDSDNSWKARIYKKNSEIGMIASDLLTRIDKIIIIPQGRETMEVNEDNDLKDADKIECCFYGGKDKPKEVRVSCKMESGGDVQDFFIDAIKSLSSRLK